MLSSIVETISDKHSKVIPTNDWLTNRCLSLYLFRIRDKPEDDDDDGDFDEKLQPIDSTYANVACSNIEEAEKFFRSMFQSQGFHITPADVSYSKDCIVYDENLKVYLENSLSRTECMHETFTSVFEPFCFVDNEDKQNIYHEEFGFRMVKSPSVAYMSRRNVSPYYLYFEKKPFIHVLVPSDKVDRFKSYDSRMEWKEVSCCEGIEFCLVNGRYLTCENDNSSRCILENKLCFFKALNWKVKQAERNEMKEWKAKEKERRRRETTDEEDSDVEEEEEEEKSDEDNEDEFYEREHYSWFHRFLEMYGHANRIVY